MFGFPYYIFWLIAIVALVALEASTMALTCIWFAVGALAAFTVSFFGVTFTIQLMVFAIVSALALTLVRPVAREHFSKAKTATNADRVLGATAVVVETIDNEQSSGQVSVRGQVWTARSAEDGVVIEKGGHVTVREIQGVKLIVDKINETKECSTL